MDFLPSMIDNRNKTMKIKNRTLAIPAALAATPVKPNIPATMATIKKITVQRNIGFCFMMNNIFNNFRKCARKHSTQ